jgi:hypothetical protein
LEQFRCVRDNALLGHGAIAEFLGASSSRRARFFKTQYKPTSSYQLGYLVKKESLFEVI